MRAEGNLFLKPCVGCCGSAGACSKFALCYALHLANTRLARHNTVSCYKKEKKKDDLFLFSLTEWLPVMSLICVTWHSHKSTPAGEFIIPINAEGYGFNLIALSWLRWRLIFYAAQTLWIVQLFFLKMSEFYESFRFQAQIWGAL